MWNKPAKKDLIAFEKFLDHNNFNEKHISLLLATAIYYGHHYRYWTLKSVKNELAISRLIHILGQNFRRPYWRVSFVLQYVDQDTLEKVLSELENDKPINGVVGKVLKPVKNRSVKEYFEKCMWERDNLIDPHDPQLLFEFDRPWKVKVIPDF